MEDQLDSLMTDRVCALLEEARQLRPDATLVLNTVTREELPEESAGALVSTDNAGNATVSVDPSQASEYMVAHELMHVILHRSGWPQVHSMLTQEIDPFGVRLANSLDDVFDHYILNQRLEALGFAVDEYREWFLTVLATWPDVPATDAALMWDAIKLLDGMLFGSSYRKRIAEAVEPKQPEALALARRLQHTASSIRAKSKTGSRSAMVKVLDFLEVWITEKSEEPQHLRQRIAIGPLFSRSQLRRPASATVELASHSMSLGSRSLWMCRFVLRSDGTSIHSVTLDGPLSEPSIAQELRQELETRTLADFVGEHFLRYGLA